MKQILQSFTGTGDTPTEAADSATEWANSWLESHQWVDSNSRSIYNIVGTTVYSDNGAWVYIIHLLGPDQTTV